MNVVFLNHRDTGYTGEHRGYLCSPFLCGSIKKSNRITNRTRVRRNESQNGFLLLVTKKRRHLTGVFFICFNKLLFLACRQIPFETSPTLDGSRWSNKGWCFCYSGSTPDGNLPPHKTPLPALPQLRSVYRKRR